MAYGKLCLSSDASSMTEIAGDLNEYYSPYDPVACLHLIQKYLDKKTRTAREKEIKKQYQPTTWHDMYEQINVFLKTL
jgi:hypothetical protein